MLFLIVRFLPLILPVIYYGMFRAVFVFTGWWPYLTGGMMLINLLYFILLDRKVKRKRIWFFAIYSEIFVALGFAYASILSSQLFINLFLVIWSLVYMIYLEAVFNYLYRTERFFLLEIKSITAYINVVLLFLLSFCLLNFYILFNMRWWWLFIGFIPIAFIIVFNRFLSFELPHRTNIFYSSVITLILTEFLAALIWWPNSIYVLSFILVVFYYLLSSLATSAYKEQLTKKVMLQYILLAAIVMILVLATAQWL